MHVFRFGAGVLIGVQLLWAVAAATSLDGTSSIKYQRANYVFHGADYARGFVRFNNGFTVLPNAGVFMDTVVSASGGFDLRDTGTLILMGNLYLDSPVTLTSGGNIKGRPSVVGQANTIFMGGDLTLSATTFARALHIIGDWSGNIHSGDLIIDGCGHTINIGDRAQILVDQNITLTLRNMTIRTGPKSVMKPPIQLVSHGSTLALDNVMFDLGADFRFTNGQIFIHNEVAVTGTSAFIYNSPKPSYITSGATWSFETGTTFSVAPATYTDQPFTAGVATSNNFIVPVDQSAALSLSGCSFKTTFTGARFTKGMVLFDNKVALDTQAAVGLQAGTSFATLGLPAPAGSHPSSVSWSPDGRFLAITNLNQSAQGLQLYSFNGSGAPVPLITVSTGTQPQNVVWSLDGRFLVLADADGLKVYRFNGSSAPILLGTSVTSGTSSYVSLSPDGRFIAAVSTGGAYLDLYKFDGINAPVQVGVPVSIGLPLMWVSWSPDGRFLAVVDQTSTLRVYRFNGGDTPTIVGSSVPTGAGPFGVMWSPDGRFLAVANTFNLAGGNTLQVFSFNGSSSPVPVDIAVATGVNPMLGVWSPNGGFIAVVNYSQPAQGLQVFYFSGSSRPVLLGSSPTGSNPQAVAWSPDGMFLAVANYGSNNVQVYSCNFAVTAAYMQGFTNGLVFGDSAKGSAYNANVQINGGARVELTGKMKDDSA